MNFENIELAAAELRNEPWVTPVSMSADPAVRAYLIAVAPTRVHELIQFAKRQKAAHDNLVLEVAAEKQRADQMQEQAQHAAAAVQAEQQRYEKLAQELAAAKAAIPAQTGMLSLEWDAVNSAANTANNNFGQWMPERWLQEFVKAYNASIPAKPVQQPAPVAEPHYEAGRKQGRAEALAILMQLDPEGGIDGYTGWSTPVGPEDEGAAYWEEDKLRELFAADGALADMMDRAEAEYWKYLGMQDEAERARNFAANMHNSDKVREVLSKAGEFDLMGRLCSTAPVAAPVAMPAASVQPTENWLSAVEGWVMKLNEWRLCMSYNSSYFGEPQGLVKRCTEEMEHLFRNRKQKPDSGRDAALVETVSKAVEWLINNGHMDWCSDGADESGHEDGFNSHDEEAATLCHYVRKALAAHPANVAQPASDAALKMEPHQHFMDRAALNFYEANKADFMLKSDHEIVQATWAYFASNVAQVGELSDAQIESIFSTMPTAGADDDFQGAFTYLHKSYAHAILAAAKKGPNT